MVIHMTKGPTGPEADAETDADASPEDVLETVEWAMTTENVEMANLFFEDDGEVSPHVQLLGPRYNLTGLSEDRVENAQRILSEWCADESGLEPEESATAFYMDVEVYVTVEEHKQVVESLLNEVYDTRLKDIEEITRSTVSQTEDTRDNVPKVASDPKRLREEFKQVGVGLEDGEIGGHVQLDGELNLNALAIGLGLENIEYEPEKFPGLIYQTVYGDAVATTVVLFWDGQITAVDAPSEVTVREGIITVVQRLQELGLWEEEIPDEGSIAVSETNP
jgi:hypothetical protein